MNKHVPDDENLMAAVGKGNRESLTLLVRRFATPLLTFLERLVGNRHQAEELFQEVFLAVWVHRARYEYPRPFRAWLYAIAVNKTRTLLRGPSSPRPIVDDEITEPSASSPIELAIATETATLIDRAVALLPPRQRAVMVLRIWQELSYSEIAQILETTEGSARATMHHGLAAIRKYLEPRLC